MQAVCPDHACAVTAVTPAAHSCPKFACSLPSLQMLTDHAHMRQAMGRVTDTVAVAAALVRAELNAAVPSPAVLQRLMAHRPTDELYRSLAGAVAAVQWLSYQSQLRQESASAAGGFEVRMCFAVVLVLPSE
jgi:hypothetical protein